MRTELDQTIASLNLTPMQKASYDFIRSLADGGKDSFVSTITLPHTFLVPPKAGTGYITLAAFNMHEFSRGSIVRLCSAILRQIGNLIFFVCSTSMVVIHLPVHLLIRTFLQSPGVCLFVRMLYIYRVDILFVDVEVQRYATKYLRTWAEASPANTVADQLVQPLPSTVPTDNDWDTFVRNTSIVSTLSLFFETFFFPDFCLLLTVH